MPTEALRSRMLTGVSSDAIDVPVGARQSHASCTQPGRDAIPHEQRNLRQGLVLDHIETPCNVSMMNDSDVHFESGFESMPCHEVDSPFTTCGMRNFMLEGNALQLAREVRGRGE